MPIKIKKVKLNELCEIEIGKTPPRKNLSYWGKGSYWAAISDLSSKYIYDTKEQITDFAVEKCNMRLVPQGTVIMSFKLTIGRIAITGRDLYTNEAIASFPIIDKDRLNVNFLYYVLQTLDLVSDADRAAMGATLNKKKLNQIKIPLPSPEIQKKIADVLDKAQELIDKRKQQIEMLDEFLQSVFLDMFGDPRINQKGWEMVAIEQLTRVETGSTPKRDRQDYYLNGTIPWIKTTEIKEKEIHESLERITELAIKETNCKVFPPDTILIAMYGQGQTRGRAGLLKIPAATNQACAAILPSLNVNVDFLFKQLSYRYDELRGLGRGGNQPNLNLSMVKSFNVITPPIELQNKFAEIVKATEQQKQLMEKGLVELENNFNSIMQRAFRGELFN